MASVAPKQAVGPPPPAVSKKGVPSPARLGPGNVDIYSGAPSEDEEAQNPWAAHVAVTLDIDFLTPELGESWKRVKAESEQKIKDALKKGTGEFGCFAGCAEHLIHLAAESDFLNRVLYNIRKDWLSAVLEAEPELRAGPHTELEMHSKLWITPVTTCLAPLGWFDSPREIYITFPYYL